MNTVKCVNSFAALPQQQSLSQMDPQNRLPVVTEAYYTNYNIGHLQVSVWLIWSIHFFLQSD